MVKALYLALSTIMCSDDSSSSVVDQAPPIQLAADIVRLQSNTNMKHEFSKSIINILSPIKYSSH